MSGRINRNRWQKLKEVFNTALTRKGNERDEYLKKECGTDEELMNEVLALINAYDQPGAFDRSLEQLKTAAISQMDNTGILGKQIGPYRIVDELGYGGMGIVFRAERTDGEFEQKVALKLLRTGFTSDEQIRRFRIERQILATLTHEYIARLYDGGITNDGQPYFVMEYVEGLPIDEYCNTHNLNIPERLRLFLNVCDAVQFAHRKLIVHRDLKPSNILVTNEGTVKLLDFGIAKVLNAGEMFGESKQETQTGLLPLTPAYASPEQVLGEPITTSSDIYQLGIILYELLTGVRPYEVTGRTPGEIERIICDEEPTKPSTVLTKRDSSSVSRLRRTASGQLHHLLRGELDTIVMMLLHKEPDRRYNSAEQLAADIKRYLGGKPVSAYPDSWIYRTRKFVRRHGLTVAAVSIIILLLIGYGITITWHSQRTQLAFEQAQREAEKAEQVTSFLMGMFEANDPAEALGDTITARVLLERGIEQAEQLDDRPALQAQMFDIVGQVYGRLGAYDRAIDLLRHAIDIRNDHYGEMDDETAITKVHLANNIRKTGDYDTASEILEKALAIQRTVLEPDHRDIGFTLSILGGVRMAQGKLEDSEKLLRDALTIQRNEYDGDNPDIAETLNILGLLLDQKGKTDDAIPYMQEAVRIRRNLFNADDPRLAMSVNNLAMLYRMSGAYQDAEPLYREALEIKRHIFSEEHPSIAVTLNGLGLVLQDLGRTEEAEPYLREALSIRRQAFGDVHPRVAGSLNNLGNLIEDQGNLDEAAIYLREAREMFRTTVGESHPFVAYPTLGLSRILMKQNKPHEAEPYIREALSIREESLPASHWKNAESKAYLGRCLTLLGRFDEAETLLTEGYEMLHAELGLENTTTRRVRQWIVEVYEEWGRTELAQVYREEIIKEGEN
jgi:eukaryotic-like serine/threonine-protein kinase